MMDIVDRLRELYLSTGVSYVQEAADEIERLRAELADTRKYAFLEAARFCDELRHPDGMEYETRDWLLGTELCADGLRNEAMKEGK